MGWIKLTAKGQHQCDPPEEPAYSDVTWISKCAVGSWDDIWQCDECQRYWVPRSSVLPFHSHWEELKGLKLWWRLRGLS